MIFEKIERYCKENKIPISIFEKKCGLGNGTISGWKDSNPRIDSLMKVAKEMNIPIEKLVDGEEATKNENYNRTK